MLRAAGIFPEATSSAALRLKSNSILDLYMALFVQEVRYLLQTGLVRKYRKTDRNSTALKGRLQFAQNIRHNLTHAERFYVRHTTYDRNHLLNAILSQCLELIQAISRHSGTASAAGALLLDFPECSPVRISDAVFARLRYDRKTAAYQQAIGMAKLLLLRYHPDVRQGRNDVLALMFDMNALWEKYVFRALRHEPLLQGYSIHEQVRNDFWQPDAGYTRTVRPDIVIRSNASDEDAIVVLDTKWKRLRHGRVDDADLKQMLVYNLYNKCTNSALVYPASAEGVPFYSGTFHYGKSFCHAAFLPLFTDERCGMKLELAALVEWINQCALINQDAIIASSGNTW